MTSPPPAPTFVLVGHCVPDSGMLRSVIGRVSASAEIVRVNDASTLARYRRGDCIWLINRVLDGDFDGDDGFTLIKKARVEPLAGKTPVVILISNYADAQEEAVELGALPGFGKKSLYADATTEALRHAIAAASRNAERTAEGTAEGTKKPAVP